VEDCSPIFYRNAGKIESNPNYQTAQGKITINCWDSSWNAYWGGMGPRTVAEFEPTNFATSNPPTSAGIKASCSPNYSAKSGTTPSVTAP
jgi:hypothetical protein